MTTEVVEALEVNLGFQLQSPLEGFTRGANTKEMDSRNIIDANFTSYAHTLAVLELFRKKATSGFLEFYLGPALP